MTNGSMTNGTTNRLDSRFAELKQAGRAILLVEQNVPQALTLCDRFVAMERGRVVLKGDARDAADCERLLAAITV